MDSFQPLRSVVEVLPIASSEAAADAFVSLTDSESCASSVDPDVVASTAPSYQQQGARAEYMTVQNCLLAEKVDTLRKELTDARDQQKYLEKQLSLRDKRLVTSRVELSAMEQRNQQLQNLVDSKSALLEQSKATIQRMVEEADQAKQEILKLQWAVRASCPVTEAKQVVPDRRFQEAFQDKVQIIRLVKRVRRLLQRREGVMQSMEHAAMMAEDDRSTLANETGAINQVVSKLTPSSEDSQQPATQRRRASSLISFESVKRYGRGPGGLPYHEPLVLQAPHDVYTEAKVKASAFTEHLTELRSNVRSVVSQLKETTDKAMASFYYIFNESGRKGANSRGILANPRDDFEREIKNTMSQLRKQLQDFVGVMDQKFLALTNSEKAVRIRWALEGRSRVDQGVQVDIPPPEDPRIAILAEKLQISDERRESMRKDHQHEMVALESLKDKAEVNTLYIQQKLFHLHDAVYHALHAVYRHRFHWVHRFPNTFLKIDRQAKRSVALEVQYNTKVAVAVDEDLHYLRKFADYFVCDDIYGADLAGVKEESSTTVAAAMTAHRQQSGATALSQKNSNNNQAYLVAKRKEAVPARKRIDEARKLSGQLESMRAMELIGSEGEVAAADDDKENMIPSGQSTPRNCSFTEVPTYSNGAMKPQLSGPVRYVRSANCSPERAQHGAPGPQRPQSARRRSGSVTSSIPMPSRPPTAGTYRRSTSEVAEAPLAPFRRVGSFGSAPNSAASSRPSSATSTPVQSDLLLPSTKVTLQLTEKDGRMQAMSSWSLS